jgi:hypothetical protein
MHDAFGMNIRKSIDDLFYYVCNRIFRKCCDFFNEIKQCTPFTKFGNHVIKVVIIEQGLQFNDSRMVEFGQ